MRLFFGFAILILVASCTDTKKKEIDKLSDEVIVLHDEVMPLMDGLYQTRMKLQKLVDTDSSADDSARIEGIARIKRAEDAMMDWMHNFNPSYEGANPDETIQYLLDQKKSIEAVGKKMRTARKEGEALLNQ